MRLTEREFYCIVIRMLFVNLLVGIFLSPGLDPRDGAVVLHESRTMSVTPDSYPSVSERYTPRDAQISVRTPLSLSYAKPTLPFSPEDTREALSKKTDAKVMVPDIEKAKKLGEVDLLEGFKTSLWRSHFVADNGHASLAVYEALQACVVANAAGEKLEAGWCDFVLACAMIRNMSTKEQPKLRPALKAEFDKFVAQGAEVKEGVARVAVHNMASALREMCKDKNGEQLLTALGGDVSKLDALTLSAHDAEAANSEVRSIFFSLLSAKLTMVLISMAPVLFVMTYQAWMKLQQMQPNLAISL